MRSFSLIEMFPIELNQGGNYLIIRLCLTRPCGEKPRAGERVEGWKEGRKKEECDGNIEIKKMQLKQMSGKKAQGKYRNKLVGVFFSVLGTDS